LRDTVFFKQAELLLRVLPLIQTESVFALKGGTAINFFVRDLPRISVDIDLVYLPVNDRETALGQMSDALNRVSGMIERKVQGTQIVQKKISGGDFLKGMIVRREGVTVKIEPNLVLRGAVYEPETRLLCTKAEELFELSMEIRTLSTGDSTEVRPAPPSIGSIPEIFLMSAFCSAMKAFRSRSGKPSLCI